VNYQPKTSRQRYGLHDYFYDLGRGEDVMKNLKNLDLFLENGFLTEAFSLQEVKNGDAIK
jgi:hypothetical protein